MFRCLDINQEIPLKYQSTLACIPFSPLVCFHWFSFVTGGPDCCCRTRLILLFFMAMFTVATIFQPGVSSFCSNTEHLLQKGKEHIRQVYPVSRKHEEHVSLAAILSYRGQFRTQSLLASYCACSTKTKGSGKDWFLKSARLTVLYCITLYYIYCITFQRTNQDRLRIGPFQSPSFSSSMRSKKLGGSGYEIVSKHERLDCLRMTFSPNMLTCG